MPLFGSSRKTTTTTTEPVQAPATRSGSIFGSRNRNSTTTTSTRHPTTTTTAATSPTRNSRTGLFGRRRSSSSLSSDGSGRASGHRRTGTTGGIFNRGGTHDPTILAAREKVGLAEKAEKAADQALNHARQSVVEAKRHVEILEREATEEARLAQIKQTEARGLGKSAGKLGRF